MVQTAVGPMVIVAVDQHDPAPLLRDAVAARLLPAAVRPVARLARRRAVRRLVFRLTEQRIPGLWAEMLCRKRYLDDQTLAALADGFEAVVILGAGLDARPYRLPALRDARSYEVDLPANTTRKGKRLRALYGGVPDNVRLVPLDFELREPAAALAAAGHDAGARTLFLCEAVTQYLTDAAARRIFAFLATAATGSRLVFTYVPRDFLDGRNLYGAPAAYRDFVVRRPLWKFGLEPRAVADFLADYGWRETEQAGPEEYLSRYVRPSGRPLDVTGLERAVSAEKI